VINGVQVDHQARITGQLCYMRIKVDIEPLRRPFLVMKLGFVHQTKEDATTTLVLASNNDHSEIAKFNSLREQNWTPNKGRLYSPDESISV